MNFFQTIKQVLDHMGLNRSQSIEKFQNINAKILFALFFVCLFTSVLFLLASVLFFLLEAKTFREYADSFYMSTTLLSGFPNIVMIILRVEKLFKMFNTFETAILKRKSISRKSIIILYLKHFN